MRDILTENEYVRLILHLAEEDGMSLDENHI